MTLIETYELIENEYGPDTDILIYRSVDGNSYLLSFIESGIASDSVIHQQWIVAGFGDCAWTKPQNS